MRIASVNVGMPAELATHQGVVMSGIVKRPVEGPVRVGRTNLDGDGQADLSVHGGVDMAVYAYPAEHYAWWADLLGRDDLAPGFFGENLTVEGLSEDDVRIGDRLRAGTALLEVSQPRLPCFKLAARSGEPAIAKPMLKSGRTGWYLRVVEEGVLAAGDPIVAEGHGEASMTVHEIADLIGSGAAPDDLDRGAAVPALTLGWRESFAQRAIAAREKARRAPG